MGKHADMLLDGSHDEQTVEYIGEPVGYPRTIHKKYQKVSRKKEKTNSLNLNLGGEHLVGRTADVIIRNIVYVCYDIVSISGNRGKKKYLVRSNTVSKLEFKVKFSQLKNIR